MASSINLIAIEWLLNAYRVPGNVSLPVSFNRVREAGRVHEVGGKVAADYRDEPKVPESNSF